MKIQELSKYSEKKIAILWYGKEGKSSKDFLERIWYKNINILDKNTSWENYLDNLWEYDLIFKTTGISLYNENVYTYRDKIISNSEIFFNNYNGKVIWVTATKGKSTTSTLIYETLKNAWYRVKLVGNIGNPALDEVDILNWETYDYIVYELSSYMLETFKPKCFIAVFGNLFECHLAWHKDSFEIYKQAKLNILENSQNILIWNDFKHLLNTPQKSPFLKGSTQNVVEGEGFNKAYSFWKKWYYNFEEKKFFIENKEILEIQNILLQWEHNKKNISSVVWICDIISKTENKQWVLEKLVDGLKETLENFKWLPHRLEDIGNYNGITFIDDAIATTQESTIAAVETFWDKIGTLFLWWESSKTNYSKLRDILEKYDISNIVLFPDSWNDIFESFSKKLELEKETHLEWYNNYKPKLYKTTSMKNAVKFAYENTTPWKICILSNASPSFSLWKSFIAKWELFQKEVKNYH